jgi:hypothetical protein
MLLSDLVPLEQFARRALWFELTTGSTKLDDYSGPILHPGGSPTTAYRQIPSRAQNFALEHENTLARAKAKPGDKPLKIKKGLGYLLQEIETDTGALSEMLPLWESLKEAAYQAIMATRPVKTTKTKTGKPKTEYGKLDGSLLFIVTWNGVPLQEIPAVRDWHNAKRTREDSGFVGTCMFCGEIKNLTLEGSISNIGSGLAKDVGNGLSWGHQHNSGNYTCVDCWTGPVRNAVDKIERDQTLWLGSILGKGVKSQDLRMSVWTTESTIDDFDLLSIFGYTHSATDQDIIKSIRALRDGYRSRMALHGLDPNVRIMLFNDKNSSRNVVDYITVPMTRLLANVERFYTLYKGIAIRDLIRATACSIRYTEGAWTATASNTDVTRWLRRMITGPADTVTTVELHKVLQLWMSSRLRDIPLDKRLRTTMERIMQNAAPKNPSPVAALFGTMLYEYENVIARVEHDRGLSWEKAGFKARKQGIRYLTMAKSRPEEALLRMVESAIHAGGQSRNSYMLCQFQALSAQMEPLECPAKFSQTDTRAMVMAYMAAGHQGSERRKMAKASSEGSSIDETGVSSDVITNTNH